MGTPIMASGDGVVKKLDGWWWRNCVVIKHNSTYQTVYNMSKFASGGEWCESNKVKLLDTLVQLVNQRTSFTLQVIRNGEKINSQKLKLPSGKILKGNQRKKFETVKIKLDVLKSEKIIGLN